MLVSDGLQVVHIRGCAPHVGDQDGIGAGGDPPDNVGGVEIAVGVAVGQDGRRTKVPSIAVTAAPKRSSYSFSLTSSTNITQSES